MDDKPKFVLPERNPKTHAAHRKEVGWQITLPLVIGCLIIALAITGVIWSAVDANPDLSRWSDISLMWLILPALIITLIPLAVLFGLTFLVSKLLGMLPGYARLVQDTFVNIQSKVLKFSDALVAPSLKLKSWSAGARRARQAITEPLQPTQRVDK